MTVRQITDVAEAEMLHGLASSWYEPSLSQFCAGAPPHPSLNEIRRFIESGCPVLLREEGGQADGFIITMHDGTVIWVVLDTREDLRAGRPDSYIPIIADMLVFVGRSIGSVKPPMSYASGEQQRSALGRAYDLAAQTLASEGEDAEVTYEL